MQNLYRHFNKDGILLYVGISISHANRLSAHKRLSPWFSEISKITIEQFETRKEAIIAERTAIINEEPLYNFMHKIKTDIVKSRVKNNRKAKKINLYKITLFSDINYFLANKIK